MGARSLQQTQYCSSKYHRDICSAPNSSFQKELGLGIDAGNLQEAYDIWASQKPSPQTFEERVIFWNSLLTSLTSLSLKATKVSRLLELLCSHMMSLNQALGFCLAIRSGSLPGNGPPQNDRLEMPDPEPSFHSL